MKRILLIVVGACIILAGIVYYFSPQFVSPAREPLYGAYQASDLVTHTNYENAQALEITKDPLETIRMVNQLGVSGSLKKLHEESQETDGICHTGAHRVGVAAFELFGERAFSMCDSSCHFGCVHGAMDRLVSEEGATQLLSSVQKYCSAFDTHFYQYSCFHGSGHGFLTSSNYDLPAAIDGCRLLDTTRAQDACIEGVFMENVMAGGGESSGADQNWLSRDDLYFPCTLFNDDPQVTRWCYDVQAQWIIKVLKDSSQVRDECLDAPGNGAQACLGNLAKATSFQRWHVPERTVTFCRELPMEYQEHCLIEASRLALQAYDRDFTGQGTAFCKGMTDLDAKEICVRTQSETVGEMYALDEERITVCNLFEEQYRAQCLTTARTISL
ncbi:hypothetical protein K2Y00_03525 [Patescibacteria group bacterium]|nr:hypothetical protein [Patescibacteria group bacterium]